MGLHSSTTGRAEPWPLIEQPAAEPISLRGLVAIVGLMAGSFLSGMVIGLCLYGWITYR